MVKILHMNTVHAHVHAFLFMLILTLNNATKQNHDIDQAHVHD